MNKEQLIALATRKYQEQLQREYYYRQAIRDGLVERCESTDWNISDNDWVSRRSWHSQLCPLPLDFLSSICYH